MFLQEGNRLNYQYDAEKLWIEPWGPNSFRIRSTVANTMPAERWALEDDPTPSTPTITIEKDSATIGNGKIKATVTSAGKLTIHNSNGMLLLEEYARTRQHNVLDPKTSALEISAREHKPHPGHSSWHLTWRLESVSRAEKLYGMGQYQQPFLDLKGTDLELAHRNSQASVPFMLSSLGYGMLWNNPAIGRAVLGKNVMSFEAYSSGHGLDVWITAGDRPREIVQAYVGVTGKVPMMPEYGLGFWQCKLRYQTQEELLQVAREYKRRELPIDLIVVDFFHWPLQGEWKFDGTYWPDPGMSDTPKDEADSKSINTLSRRNDQGTERHGYRANGIRLADRRPPL